MSATGSTNYTRSPEIRIRWSTLAGCLLGNVDPTPRAIRHCEEIEKRIGEPAAQSYSQDGKLAPGSYDLSKLVQGSLVLEPSALWVEATTLKFFAPPDASHVSHSIVNYQNDYRQDSPYIEVPATTLEDLIAKHGLERLPLMKIDIEGAEIEVIKGMMAKSIHPRQLLVEFDEMNCPSARSRKNVEDVDGVLRKTGYECRYFDGHSNYFYVHR
jgi:FkbM family methyltransferase